MDDQLQVASGIASAQNGVAAPTRGGKEEKDAKDTSNSNAAMVTTKILAQYYVNPQLKPWNIDVSTSQDGVVTLEGTIDNDKDRTEAVRIAKSTGGVTDVHDPLRANDVAATSGTTSADKGGGAVDELSDGWITTKIQSRFYLDPDIKGRDINVDTNNGVVVLRGTVGSYSARRQAVGVARNTDDVHEVRDELRVDTNVDRANGVAARTRGSADDDMITARIRSKLFVEKDLRASGIDVSSRNGVVTLDGTVASKEAKDTAVQLARDTDGVRNVRDRLKVKSGSSTQ